MLSDDLKSPIKKGWIAPALLLNLPCFGLRPNRLISWAQRSPLRDIGLTPKD